MLLLITWKCVPLVDLFNALLWEGRNGLPPTGDTLHLGCSYHLHFSHHYLHLRCGYARQKKAKQTWRKQPHRKAYIMTESKSRMCACANCKYQHLLWFIERLKQLEAAKLLIDAVCAKAEGGGLISISMRACQDFSVIHIYCRCANKFILAHSHFWLLECDPGDLAVQLLHIPVLSCSKQTLCCGCSYFITTLEKLEWIYLAHTPGHTLSTCRHYT